MLGRRAVVTCSLSASLVPMPTTKRQSSAALARRTFGWATIPGMDVHHRCVTAVAMGSRHICASQPLIDHTTTFYPYSSLHRS
jgi:hypothetical protein